MCTGFWTGKWERVGEGEKPPKGSSRREEQEVQQKHLKMKRCDEKV
jgi:hypothetical protein